MSTGLAELTAMLAEVNVTIRAIVTGEVQSRSVRGVAYTKLELPALREWRNELNREIATAAGTRTRVRLADFSGGAL